ncbi:hypothetical protein PV11_01955 [Exophiala sideris]|uniref:Uncharacterized protein n=1 Tax=Exophiala sideris TaxID=1016849 RepID=A0A0D1ZHM6_9EURO|nr:hypothetical protein PV11_01955 [Exophiala sideris]
MRTFRALSDLWSVWRNEQVVHVPKNCSNVPIASFSVEFPTHLSWSQAGANLVDDRIQTNISDVRVLLLVQVMLCRCQEVLNLISLTSERCQMPLSRRRTAKLSITRCWIDVKREKQGSWRLCLLSPD